MALRLMPAKPLYLRPGQRRRRAARTLAGWGSWPRIAPKLTPEIVCRGSIERRSPLVQGHSGGERRCHARHALAPRCRQDRRRGGGGGR